MGAVRAAVVERLDPFPELLEHFGTLDLECRRQQAVVHRPRIMREDDPTDLGVARKILQRSLDALQQVGMQFLVFQAVIAVGIEVKALGQPAATLPD